MFESHYPAMIVAYLVSIAGWLLAARLLPDLWPKTDAPSFERPWLETALALAGGAGVILVGQLWSHGIRLPEQGPAGPFFGAINQLLIFAPLALLPLWRRHPWRTAWLPATRILTRIAVGAALAAAALAAYCIARAGTDTPWRIAGRVIAYGNVDELAQVFLEDVVIAILFVRLSVAIGGKWAVGLVAALFAAGHVPALYSSGASAGEMFGLVRDAILGVVVISALRRSQDILWFWPIHFTMDMMQFDRIGMGR